MAVVNEFTLGQKIAAIREDMREEYLQPHRFPWIVGFSGGKDSTLLVHLVYELLLSLAPDDWYRHVYIISNDTKVESPLVTAHIHSIQNKLRRAAEAWRMPVTVDMTWPDEDETFWVNLIGRGYPPPTPMFRWCTDRMKIRPTSRYILRHVAASGEVILLLGVRRRESATRAGTVARYDNGMRLHPHNDLRGCMVYRPILELSTEDVWEYLASVPPPWGGSHDALLKLYRDAGGGECPIITQKSEIPSCGTTSRFGCWTCTVVEKDRSLEGFISSGFDEFVPLSSFRDWLISIRDDPNRRLARRRDGRITMTKKGAFIPGPFTLQARLEILERLLQIQEKMGQQLITQQEIDRIRAIWTDEVAAGVMHST